jgi:hypothetical protein
MRHQGPNNSVQRIGEGARRSPLSFRADRSCLVGESDLWQTRREFAEKVLKSPLSLGKDVKYGDAVEAPGFPFHFKNCKGLYTEALCPNAQECRPGCAALRTMVRRMIWTA